MEKARGPEIAVRNNKLANDRLQGMTYKRLAKKYGISKTRVSQILSQPEIKEVIETGTSQMISLIPLACQIYQDTMENRTKNPSLALKASETILKTGGIVPSNVTNQTVSNVYNIQNNVTLNPGVAEALSKAVNMNDPDMIEDDDPEET